MSKARGLADLGNVYNDGALSNRNVIINGEFLVWQRSDNGYSGGGQAYVSADRFTTARGRIRKPNTNVNTGEDNRGAVFDTTDGNVYAHFDYAVEDVGQTLNGKTMTFSFYAKVLSGGTTLLLEDTGGDHLDFGGNRYITLTSNWERYTVTGTLVSTGASSGVVMPRLYLNPTGVAEPRMIQVDQFQLEVGDTSTPFEHRSYAQELTACQRYYQRLGLGVPLAVNSNATYMQVSCVFPVTMRANPTVSQTTTTLYGITATATADFSGTNSSISTVNAGPKGLSRLRLTGLSATPQAYRTYAVYTEDKLAFDAEL